MKIPIIGATGGTGQATVREALSRGDAVTALVRSEERLGDYLETFKPKREPAMPTDSFAPTLQKHPLASYCWKVLIALHKNGTSFEEAVRLGSLGTTHASPRSGLSANTVTGGRRVRPKRPEVEAPLGRRTTNRLQKARSRQLDPERIPKGRRK